MARKAKTQQLMLKLDGKVMADTFVRAVGDFIALVKDVTGQVTASMAGEARALGDGVDWVVSVTKGSINLAVTPDVVNVPARAAVRAVATGMRQIGKKAERPRFFTDAALRLARNLAVLVDGKALEAVQLKASPHGGKAVDLSAKVAANVDAIMAGQVRDYGSVEGKLEMISVRNGPHFTVYDALTDQGVPCHIPTEKLAEAMDAFGKRVSVSGLIRYRKTTGEPLSIEVEELRVFPDRTTLPTADDVYGILSQAE